MKAKSSTTSNESVDIFQDLSKLPTYKAGILQSSAHRALKKVIDDALKPHGLTMMQWLFIGATYDRCIEGIRITDLARQLGTTLPYATTTVNTLEYKGMLWRSPHDDDSRSKLIYIDKSFMHSVEGIEIDLRQAMRDSIYAKVTPEELRTYINVLYKMSSI